MTGQTDEQIAERHDKQCSTVFPLARTRDDCGRNRSKHFWKSDFKSS